MIEMKNADGTVVKVQPHAVRTMERRGFKRVGQPEEPPVIPQPIPPQDDGDTDD